MALYERVDEEVPVVSASQKKFKQSRVLES